MEEERADALEVAAQEDEEAEAQKKNAGGIEIFFNGLFISILTNLPPSLPKQSFWAFRKPIKLSKRFINNPL